MLTPGEYAAVANDFAEERTAKIYALYQERLRASHAVDFDDLLMLTVHLFRTSARPGLLPEALAVRAGGRVPGHQTRPSTDRELLTRATGTSAWWGTTISRSTAGGSRPQQHPGLRAGSPRLPGHQAGAELPLHPDHPGRRGGVVRNNRGRKGKTLWTENPSGNPVLVTRDGTSRARPTSSSAPSGNWRPSTGIPWRTLRCSTGPTPSPRVLEDALRRDVTRM